MTDDLDKPSDETRAALDSAPPAPQVEPAGQLPEPAPETPPAAPAQELPVADVAPTAESPQVAEASSDAGPAPAEEPAPAETAAVCEDQPAAEAASPPAVIAESLPAGGGGEGEVAPPAKAAAPAPRATAKKPTEKAAKKSAKKTEVTLSSEEPKSENLQWYILKVQSNREDSIREGLIRRIRIAGLDKYFGDIIVPMEKVTEFKGGKRRVTKRKLYPGYLVVHMEINEDTWFLVRETPGIGDFTGASGHPSPMLPHEVNRILARQDEKTDEAPKLKINFNAGDRVKINEGTFENFEGEVDTIDQTNGRVTVMINIFGRSTPVELEYWQIETI